MITGSYRLAGLWTTGNISELCQDVAQHCQIPPSSQAALEVQLAMQEVGQQLDLKFLTYIQDLGNVCDHWE